jgi:hypothetical protein
VVSWRKVGGDAGIYIRDEASIEREGEQVRDEEKQQEEKYAPMAVGRSRQEMGNFTW